jgi:hypothetical protein
MRILHNSSSQMRQSIICNNNGRDKAISLVETCENSTTCIKEESPGGENPHLSVNTDLHLPEYDMERFFRLMLKGITVTKIADVKNARKQPRPRKLWLSRDRNFLLYGKQSSTRKVVKIHLATTSAICCDVNHRTRFVVVAEMKEIRFQLMTMQGRDLLVHQLSDLLRKYQNEVGNRPQSGFPHETLEETLAVQGLPCKNLASWMCRAKHATSIYSPLLGMDREFQTKCVMV